MIIYTIFYVFRKGVDRTIILEVYYIYIISAMDISIRIYIRHPPVKYLEISSIFKEIRAKIQTMVFEVISSIYDKNCVHTSIHIR